MKPRATTWVYAGLLAASFAATYAFIATRSGAHLPDAAPESAGQPGAMPTAHGAGAVAAVSALATGGVSSDEGGAALPETREQAQAHDLITQTSRDATSAPDVVARSAAVAQLGALASRLGQGPQPQVMQALGDVAVGDQQWQIRMRAVIAVANAARRATDRAQAISILERATHDTHRAVAARATAALSGLNEAMPTTDDSSPPG